jgi:hypothetical protein
MASAIQLTATATIINGQGLNSNAAIVNEIITYRNQSTLALISNLYVQATTYSNVANVIIPVLVGNIGHGVTSGLFLLDLYPSNITPAVTPNGTISYYGGTSPSAIGTFLNQVNAPFSNGLSGFVSSFIRAQGYAFQVFDTIASTSMLSGKTYGDMGQTGPIDAVTGGIGAHALLLSQTISNWGTMYDITKLTLLGDPYIFGQNLLNQGLGTVGNIVGQLSATGLNTTDITSVPASRTTTTVGVSSTPVSTPIGRFQLPIVANVTTTTTVTANNPQAITAIYDMVTGTDLQSIVSATQFTATNTNATLTNFLTLSKVVGNGIYTQLNAIGIYTLSDLGLYLNVRLGTNTYASWAKLAAFLANVHVPTFTSSALTTANATTSVLSGATVGTLLTITGRGTGPFGNPTMSDYFGAVAGLGYTANLHTINSTFANIAPPVITAMNGLVQAVNLVNIAYLANVESTAWQSNITMISSNIVLVNAAMNSLASNTMALASTTAYYHIMNKLALEVSNLSAAGITFGPGNPSSLMGFGKSIGTYGGTDKTGIGTNTVITSLVTGDAAGETIQAAIAESNNGASFANDPKPFLITSQAAAQGVPVTTYMAQNK